MTAAPYRVVDGSHWAFEGTGLANGDEFGQRSLHERIPGGASGHVANGVNTHGGLYAWLKSSTVVPSSRRSDQLRRCPGRS